MGLIIMRRSVRLLSLPLSELVSVYTHRWSIHQLNVKNAFLHDYLYEDVFMVAPRDFWILSSPIMFANYTKHFMASNKLHVLGSSDSAPLLFNRALFGILPIPHCSLFIMVQPILFYYFILMILCSLVMILWLFSGLWILWVMSLKLKTLVIFLTY